MNNVSTYGQLPYNLTMPGELTETVSYLGGRVRHQV